MSPDEKKELDKNLDDWLERGYIHVSDSPFAVPVFFIKKKDCYLRLIQDY